MPWDSNDGWPEWVIGICVAALSLLAVWTVFGQDIDALTQLFQR